MSVAQREMDQYLMMLKTVQSTTFRNVFETLKDCLCDVNVVFDQTGMKACGRRRTRVRCLHLPSPSVRPPPPNPQPQSSPVARARRSWPWTPRTRCSSMKLDASSFECYHCVDRLLVGVNLANLFRLIKSVGSSDTLTLCVTKSDPNKLEIMLQNFDKNTSTRYKLNQLDLDDTQLSIPEQTFDLVLTMPSVDWQRTCRDMAVLSENLTISASNRCLHLHAKGDFAEQLTVIGEKADSGGLLFSDATSSDEPLTFGSFSLKYLSIFSKACVLCQTVHIYLKRDYPLILSYTCANMGKLLFVLGQKRVT